MAFKQLKNVDKRQQYAVYGWVRNKEQELKLDHIPSMVTAIFILYFREFEVFAKDLIAKNLNVDDTYKVVWNPDSNIGGGNAYGSNLCIKNRSYHWRVKLDKACSSSSGICINIGIIQADDAKNTLIAGWWGEEHGYAYLTHDGGGSIWNGNIKCFKEYGSCVKPDDYIDVWLDLRDNNSLSFGKNDTKYGKAFDICDDKKYRLAVNVRHAKVSIEQFDVCYT